MMKSNYLTLFKALSTATLAFASSAFSADVNTGYQVQREITQAIPEGLQSEQPRVEYIWPAVLPVLSMAANKQQISSDYYWQVVSGKQLTSGVKIYTTTEDALLRLAPKADYSSGVKLQSKDLDLTQMTLTGAQDKTLSLKQIASVEAMKLAGFDDGSVALRLPQNHSVQPMVLKTQQRLADDAQYLLQVKEKHSPYTLDIEAKNAVEQNDNVMSLSMQVAGQAVNEASTDVQLLSQNGPSVAVTYQDGQVKLPRNLTNVGAFQGLYELQITTLANVEGQWVKRSAKVPFAQHVKTAELAGALQRKGDHLYVPLMVHEPGRYSVTATLQAFTKLGKQVNVQTADVAQWLAQPQDLRLPFDLSKFEQLQGPFTLLNVQLKDQGRMMPLQYAPTLQYATNAM
ncbi:MAG: DUF4785 domain-containing protein [Aestuariibacter sp.]